MMKQTKLYEGEYRVHMLALPGDIHGAVRIKDDFPTIFINDQLGPQGRRRAFDHEMRHLENDDFYNGKDIREVEAE